MAASQYPYARPYYSRPRWAKPNFARPQTSLGGAGGGTPIGGASSNWFRVPRFARVWRFRW